MAERGIVGISLRCVQTGSRHPVIVLPQNKKSDVSAYMSMNYKYGGIQVGMKVTLCSWSSGQSMIFGDLLHFFGFQIRSVLGTIDYIEVILYGIFVLTF